MAPSPLPVFSFFPALPLSRNLDLGEWLIGSPPDEVAWRSTEFRDLALKLLTSFATGDPKLEGGAVMWHKARGFDGSSPTPQEFWAIQAAVRFAALDCNDHVGTDDPNKGHHLITSENAAFHVQPIDEMNHYITHRSDGRLKYTLGGGWKIGDRAPPVAGATGEILGVVRISRAVAKAVFDAHMTQASDLTRRLCIAVEWHAVALANASAVSWQQRIIALKTGFEALLGTSKSREGAKRLRALFESTAKGHEHLFPTANALWSPKERADLSRPFKGKPGVMSEVEDWFMALANARNDIIHEGKITNTEYAAPPERPLSRYARPLFWIGERVLREAIKARLGADIWLCGPLKAHAAWEKLRQTIAAVPQPTTTAEPPPSSGVPSTTSTTARPRTVKALIAELACPAANHVQMVYKSVGSSRSEKAAHEMAEPCWVAIVGAKEIWISETEHDLLEKAGAEQALPDHLIVCD